jgi:hypothetical protein
VTRRNKVVNNDAKKETLIENWLTKAKNQPVIALMIFLGMILAAIASFKKNLDTILPSYFSSVGIAQTIFAPETYKLHPTLPLNRPISRVTEFQWIFPAGPKKCVSVTHIEDIFTVKGRDSNAEPSSVRRKFVSNKTTIFCSENGNSDSQQEVIGPLEGKEVHVEKTAEGVWVQEEFTGITEKQKDALKNEGFTDPFSGMPDKKVPVGEVITFKDEKLSLLFGSVFPGKKEGIAAVKFEHVNTEREPVAQLSVMVDASMTILDESNNEAQIKLSINGGGKQSLSEKAKIESTTTFTGIMSYNLVASPNEVTTGPITMTLSIKEL